MSKAAKQSILILIVLLLAAFVFAGSHAPTWAGDGEADRALRVAVRARLSME